MFEQEREKTIPPEERRAKRRTKVTASEIAPSVTQADEPFLRTKTGAASRYTKTGKRAEPPANVRIGSTLKPRHMMDEQELALLQQRKEMAKVVLSRNAPETQEGVVYLPGWNLDEGGNYVKPEEMAMKESAEKVVGKMKFEYKSPLEVLDMLKTLNIFVREHLRSQSGQGGEEAERREGAGGGEFMHQRRMTGEELEIARIKMMRKHWIPWLKSALDDEEQAEIVDPAKQSREVRQEFLADMEEARAHGREDLRIPTEEEAMEFEEKSKISRDVRQSSRIERETRRVCDLTNKMSQDLSKFGRDHSVPIKSRFDLLMAGYKIPAGLPISSSSLDLSVPQHS